MNFESKTKNCVLMLYPRKFICGGNAMTSHFPDLDGSIVLFV